MYIIIIAPEKSSEMLLPSLLQALTAMYPDDKYIGITSNEVIPQIIPWNKTTSIGVLQFFAVIPQMYSLKNAIQQKLNQGNVRCIIGVDASALNLWLYKKINKNTCPIIHYVCPTFWAYWKSRKEKLLNHAKGLLTLYPFETKFFSRTYPVFYVGRPEYFLYKAKEKHPKTDVWNIALTIGSRKKEILYHLPLLKKSLETLALSYPISVHLSAATPHKELWQPWLQALSISGEFFVHDKPMLEVYKFCEIALCKSGTSSLEMALSQTPGIVYYTAFSRLEYALHGWIFGYPKWVNIANWILNESAIPEIIGPRVKPQDIVHAMLQLIENPKNYTIQQQKMELIHHKLTTNVTKIDEALKYLLLEH